jgi:predicted GNAT family N-acyltransferase
MTAKIHHAKPEDLDEIHELMLDTFRGKVRERGAFTEFTVAYEVCDPDFTPAQYLFRRYRGRIVSALKLFARRLHHPSAPVLVTILGGVCTREDMRGKGLIKPVIDCSLDYSRELGAKGVLIVTPRKGYYERYGFRYIADTAFTGPIPDLAPASGRIERLRYEDAGWMTAMYNAYPWPYGPIVRAEAYTRKWILEMRLARPEYFGVKLIRNGEPVAYAIADPVAEPLFLREAVSGSRSGSDEAALLSFFRALGRDQFACRFPEESALMKLLRARAHPLSETPYAGRMFRAISPDFVTPGDEFFYSSLDNV